MSADLPNEFDLTCLPEIFSSETVPFHQRIVHMHLFSFQTDWFILGYNKSQKIMYGMMVFRADFENAQWGFFDLEELESISAISKIHWNKSFSPRAVRHLRPLRVEFEGKVRIYT